MPDTDIECSHCGASVRRDDIRQGAAIATKSVAFCCECAKALTEEERSQLLPVSLASADAAGTKLEPGPDSMAIRNVVAKRLRRKQPRHTGLVLICAAIVGLVIIAIAVWSGRSSSSADDPSAPAEQVLPEQP